MMFIILFLTDVIDRNKHEYSFSMFSLLIIALKHRKEDNVKEIKRSKEWRNREVDKRTFSMLGR